MAASSFFSSASGNPKQIGHANGGHKSCETSNQNVKSSKMYFLKSPKVGKKAEFLMCPSFSNVNVQRLVTVLHWEKRKSATWNDFDIALIGNVFILV